MTEIYLARSMTLFFVLNSDGKIAVAKHSNENDGKNIAVFSTTDCKAETDDIEDLAGLVIDILGDHLASDGKIIFDLSELFELEKIDKNKFQPLREDDIINFEIAKNAIIKAMVNTPGDKE